jgi:cobalt-zinc-cadmium resistance protein CzcA
VQWVFLGNFRSALIVATTIPFALFFAITILVLRGESANLLSVGAIDFGLVVDATVIMVENIFRHLAEPPTALRQRTLQSARRASRLSRKLVEIFAAASEVNTAIFFSAAIIIAGFVPLFTMSGVEGHIFAPMAQTYAYAIAGGLIATFTIIPALSALLLPERVSEIETVLVRGLHRLYRPILEFALANRIVTLGGAALLFALAAIALPSLGLEFLPKLEEGNLWIRATLPPSISLEEANGYVNKMRRVIKSFPEPVTVISQNGRPDDGTDATGFFNAEFFVPLKPFDTWPSGVDKEKLTQQVSGALEAQFPGVEFNFSQYIEDNVEEAASGVKGENSVKLFGNDLATLEKTRGAEFTRPADGADRDRPRPRRALRARPGRHQFDDSRGDRRAGGRQPLRRGQRPQLSDDRASRAELPAEPRRHPPHHDRRPEPERQRSRTDPADRRCYH